MTQPSKPDLDSKENIREFVEMFYGRMLRDQQLGPIFLDVARVDLDQHLPRIRQFWEKLLLGDRTYQRHTMNIHRAIHDQRPFESTDFQLWLTYFMSTIDEHFAGPLTERAKRLARNIAHNMETTLVFDEPGDRC